MHESVLLKEVIDFLRPNRADGTLVDATIGLGGQAEALLERNPQIRLIGIDRDPRALDRARERLTKFGSRVTFAQGRHEQLIEILKQQQTAGVSGLLADLGISSLQLDDAQRGFSFRYDAPLDMRMGAEGPSAADLVNSLDEAGLARIIRQYGEEPMARRIARAIVATRPLATTVQLADVIRGVKKARPHE